MAKKQKLSKLNSGKVSLFKLRNRRGFAALCKNHLTEGRSPIQAFSRLQKAMKRSGWDLIGKVPAAKS